MMSTDMDIDVLHEEKGESKSTLGWDPVQFHRAQAVQLFGLEELTADIFTYQGKYPGYLSHDDALVYQLAAFRHDLRLSILLPDLAKTPIDQFVLANVMLTRQSFPIPDGYGAGLHFEADLELDETCGELHGVLSQVLGVKDPALHLYCGLALTQDWKEPLHLDSFTLEGTFREVLVPTPCDGVTMTSIGVRILGFETTSYNPDGSLSLGMDYGFAVFGTLKLESRKWKGPVELAYEISKISSVLALSADVMCDWEDAFGVPKLILRNIGLRAQVVLGKPLSALTFEVSATLEAGTNILSLLGSFSMDGEFTIIASLENLDWDALIDIYEHFFDERIPAPDVHLKLRRATLMISDHGFVIDIDHLEVGDFPPASGTLDIGKHGFFLRAMLEGEVVTIDEFHLSNPSIQISCARSHGSTKTDVILSGDFSWEGFILKIDLHLYTSPDEGDNSLEYTVCGQFVLDNTSSGIRFDKLVPALENCSLGGVTLDGAALIVASRDDPSLPTSMSVRYPIRQGFFVCAVIGHLEVLSTVMGGSHPQLSLAAGWQKGAGFMLAIRADDLTIDLTDGVKTDPFELKVVLSDNPALHLCCGISVEVANQSPLHFLLDCALEPKGGSITLTGAMKGMWENPFGLSKQLKIGNMILSVSILATGTPSGFGIAGEIVSGKTKLAVKLFVNKDPSKALVHVNVENLGVKEITEVVRALIGYDLPEPPDVIRFDKVELYACPSGAVILGNVYPRGFCFYSKMTIFGKVAQVKVVIGDGGLEIEGSVEEFAIGPLTVTGNKDGKALFSAALTRAKQSGKIDGVIAIAGTRAELYAKFELRPTFTFAFHFLLRIGDIFFIKVDAGPESEFQPSSCDISSKRYILEADFHQEILAYVRKEVLAEIKEAAKSMEEGAQRLRQQIQVEKEFFRQSVTSARQGLERWAREGHISNWERQQFMAYVAQVVENNIRLNPETIPSNAAYNFRLRSGELQDAKSEFERIQRSYDEGMHLAKKKLYETPLPNLLIDFAGVIARRVAPVVDNDMRSEFKPAEIRYLRAQVEMAGLLMDLVPSELSGALESHVKQLQEKLFREEHNGVLEDVLEEIDGVLKDILVAIADLMLGLVDSVGSLLYEVADGTVQLANDAIQSTLKFANGALTALLSLLDITDIHLKGALGGGSDGLSFEATIKGSLNGEPFKFTVKLHVSDFWSFIEAVLKWLFEYLKSKVI